MTKFLSNVWEKKKAAYFRRFVLLVVVVVVQQHKYNGLAKFCHAEKK